MAVGRKNPELGPPVMRALRANIRRCPEPWTFAEGGYFLQQWGRDVAGEAVGLRYER